MVAKPPKHSANPPIAKKKKKIGEALVGQRPPSPLQVVSHGIFRAKLVPMLSVGFEPVFFPSRVTCSTNSF